MSKRAQYQLEWDKLNNMCIDTTKIEWNHPIYTKMHEEVFERDDFILNPIKIEEGIFKCDKCQSTHTFNFSKQKRGGDEAITVFVRCANTQCNNAWVIN